MPAQAEWSEGPNGLETVSDCQLYKVPIDVDVGTQTSPQLTSACSYSMCLNISVKLMKEMCLIDECERRLSTTVSNFIWAEHGLASQSNQKTQGN